MAPLTSFNAEVKRSSLTLRQSIRDKGRLWIPATVQIGETVTIESPDGTRIIRPLRLAWHEPNKFFLSGVDQRTRTQRVLLRFRTAEEAGRLAVLLKEFSISVEPLPIPAEEIPISIRMLFSKRMIVPLVPRVTLGILFLAGLIFYGGEAGAFVAIFLISYLAVPVILTFSLSRLRVKRILRFDAKSVAVGTTSEWASLTTPVEMIWEGARVVILKSQGSKMEILFSSSHDAVRAAQLLRERYPSMIETNIDARVAASTESGI